MERRFGRQIMLSPPCDIVPIFMQSSFRQSEEVMLMLPSLTDMRLKPSAFIGMS